MQMHPHWSARTCSRTKTRLRQEALPARRCLSPAANLPAQRASTGQQEADSLLPTLAPVNSLPTHGQMSVVLTTPKTKPVSLYEGSARRFALLHAGRGGRTGSAPRARTRADRQARPPSFPARTAPGLARGVPVHRFGRVAAKRRGRLGRGSWGRRAPERARRRGHGGRPAATAQAPRRSTFATRVLQLRKINCNNINVVKPAAPSRPLGRFLPRPGLGPGRTTDFPLGPPAAAPPAPPLALLARQTGTTAPPRLSPGIRALKGAQHASATATTLLPRRRRRPRSFYRGPSAFRNGPHRAHRQCPHGPPSPNASASGKPSGLRARAGVSRPPAGLSRPARPAGAAPLNRPAGLAHKGRHCSRPGPARPQTPGRSDPQPKSQPGEGLGRGGCVRSVCPAPDRSGGARWVFGSARLSEEKVRRPSRCFLRPPPPAPRVT
ncbi:translation initiation factor IF-2-like [Equus quagga]|uniref:translation initiation factor IF-2-like n=1 Tax=Equus quagga TaxID=89248 RepID=UPI001EE1D064|nr:translation initiation factor IF-2-like [Equus quagga]